MLGLTILFEGRVPENSEFAQWVNDCPFIETSLSNVVEDNAAIAKRIVLSVIDDKKAEASKGDSAVTILAAATDMCNEHSNNQFVGDIFGILHSRNQAAINACKILAKDARVSEKIATLYGFDENKRKIIKQLMTNV